jgi:uncharacterized protein YicC (UPF0701 family)
VVLACTQCARGAISCVLACTSARVGSTRLRLNSAMLRGCGSTINQLAGQVDQCSVSDAVVC